MKTSGGKKNKTVNKLRSQDFFLGSDTMMESICLLLGTNYFISQTDVKFRVRGKYVER